MLSSVSYVCYLFSFKNKLAAHVRIQEGVGGPDHP